MILVGNQRGGATDLARHLMKTENERVEVHEVRGFVASDLLGAFRESYAISRSTQCKQHLYSLSLSPPKGETVSNAAFEEAIQQAEERLGLTGQPRAMIFHDKRGDDGEIRRHAHAAWCRIDADHMKAVQLSFSHRRLQSLSRELYLEHGWQLPRGLLQQGFCDPRNFTLEEWQQAKRRKKDPRVLKAMFQDAWAMSDSSEAFANALLEKGFALSRGNRRGFVAVDHTCEVYSLSRWTGEKPKDLRARLGDEAKLQSVDDAQRQIAELAASRLERLREQLLARLQNAQTERKAALTKLDNEQTEKLEALEQRQNLALAALSSEHASRFKTGLFGLLDRLSGRRKRVAEENRRERELLRRQHDQQKSQLHTQLDQQRSSLAIQTDAESRIGRAHSAIASDIETMRQRRLANNTRTHSKRKRNGPAQE